jgi:hypothetical protein
MFKNYFINIEEGLQIIFPSNDFNYFIRKIRHLEVCFTYDCAKLCVTQQHTSWGYVNVDAKSLDTDEAIATSRAPSLSTAASSNTK